MKKILPIIIIGILILSGIGAVVTGYSQKDIDTNRHVENNNIEFSTYQIRDSSEKYFEIYSEESNSYYMSPGKPMIPSIINIIELPFGVKNVNVNVLPKNVNEYKIDKEIRPSPSPLPLSIISRHYL